MPNYFYEWNITLASGKQVKFYYWGQDANELFDRLEQQGYDCHKVVAAELVCSSEGPKATQDDIDTYTLGVDNTEEYFSKIGSLDELTQDVEAFMEGGN